MEKTIRNSIKIPRKIIIQDDKLIYEVDNEEQTASIQSNKNSNSDILIPESIKINSQDYIITNILEGSFSYLMNTISIHFSNNSKLKFIHQYSFAYSSFESIIIPQTVLEIGDFAFFNCECLQKVEFSEPSELISIGSFAFVNSLIENLCIPSQVSELKKGWCSSTLKLNNVSIHSKNSHFSMVDDRIIVGKTDPKSEDWDVLLFAPRNIKYIKISSFFKRIDSYAFDRCSSLQKVEFSNDSKLTSIGEYAFAYSSFENILIPENVTNIDDNAFFYCKNLSKVIFPIKSKIKEIGRFTFAHCSFKSLFIPSSIKNIGDCAFSYCNNLQIIEVEQDFELIQLDKKIFGYSQCIIMIPCE